MDDNRWTRHRKQISCVVHLLPFGWVVRARRVGEEKSGRLQVATLRLMKLDFQLVLRWTTLSTIYLLPSQERPRLRDDTQKVAKTCASAVHENIQLNKFDAHVIQRLDLWATQMEKMSASFTKGMDTTTQDCNQRMDRMASDYNSRVNGVSDPIDHILLNPERSEQEKNKLSISFICFCLTQILLMSLILCLISRINAMHMCQAEFAFRQNWTFFLREIWLEKHSKSNFQNQSLLL